jgi:alcohol dehydrogenase
MKTFEFQLPTRIEFGFGASEGVGREAAALGARALVVTDPGIVASGIVDPIIARLTDEGVAHLLFSDISQNPRVVEVEAGVAAAKDHGCDVIVAVGGGSAIDCAKAIGALVTNGGRVQDYEGLDKLTKPSTPIIAIPTTHGTGSEVTFWYVITDADAKRKIDGGSPLMAARVALVDPELTLTLPPALTASTGIDALTHAIESYTCLLSEPLTDSLALTATRLLGRSLRRAYANGNNREARYDVMLASLLAGAAFGNSDTAAVHCISETLGGFYDIPHGVTNAIYLPIVTEYNLMADPEKHRDLAAALCGYTRPDADGEMLVEMLYQLNRDLDIPSAREVGIREEDIPQLAELCAVHVSVESCPHVMKSADFAKVLKLALAS